MHGPRGSCSGREGESTFGYQLLQWLTLTGRFACPEAFRQRLRIAGTANGDGSLDGVFIGDTKDGPGLLLIEASHGMSTPAGILCLERQTGPGGPSVEGVGRKRAGCLLARWLELCAGDDEHQRRSVGRPAAVEFDQ